MRMPLQQAETIELRAATIQKLPEHLRTPDKDEVARYLLNDVIPQGRWPMKMTELAEETGYSRQHCSNVVKEYFQPAAESKPQSDDYDANTAKHKSREDRQGIPAQKMNIEMPDNVRDKQSYLRGWIEGYTTQREE